MIAPTAVTVGYTAVFFATFSDVPGRVLIVCMASARARIGTSGPTSRYSPGSTRSISGGARPHSAMSDAARTANAYVAIRANRTGASLRCIDSNAKGVHATSNATGKYLISAATD